MKSDPENRLVTGELERRWEASLRELKIGGGGTGSPAARCAVVHHPGRLAGGAARCRAATAGVMEREVAQRCAEEGVAAKLDRQGRDPSAGTGSSANARGVARRCDDERCGSRNGRQVRVAQSARRRWKRRSSA